MGSLESDQEFFQKCVPLDSSLVIISKMTSGGYYKPHHDCGSMGHYSTTVFLSDPNEYSGGELCLCIDGKEKKFKPPLGTAITYNTGLLHMVNEVTSGERLVGVFWTRSMFDNPFIRQIYSEVSRVKNSLSKDRDVNKKYSNLSDAYNDNEFILQGVLESIVRMNNGSIGQL
jgi:PKHD-type hydroxylase